MNAPSLPRMAEPFVFGMVVLSPFQDSALQALGFAAAGGSPSFVMAAVALTLVLAARAAGGAGNFRAHPFRVMLVCALLILNLAYFAYFGFEAYGENLLVKGMKVFLLFGSLWVAYWLTTHVHLSKMTRWCRLAFAVAFGGFVWSWMAGESLNENWLVHYSIGSQPGSWAALMDERPRGFSYESSTLGMTLMSLGLVCAITSSSFSTRVVFVGTTLVLVALTGSKATLPIFVLSLSGSLLICRGVRTPLEVALAACALVFAIVTGLLYGRELLQIYVLSPLEIDMQEGISTATRSTLILASLMTSLQHPLGVGFTGYVPGVVLNIDSATQFIQAVVDIPLNFREVTGYLTQGNAFAIGTKTFFCDMTVIFGLPFVYGWLAWHRTLMGQLWAAKDVLALALSATLLLGLSLYISPINVFPVAIAYGVLKSLRKRSKRDPKFSGAPGAGAAV